MLQSGFITLNRTLINWAWYSDIKTTRVFIHLLLTANYEEHTFRKITVKRGQRVITYAGLAIELNLSVSEVRTALNHLKSTGDVTIESNSLYSIITIISYEQFAGTASEYISDNIGTANEKHQCKNNKKYKKENKSTSYDINEIKKIDTLDFID